MATTVRLELDYVQVERRRKRWNLYFILATEDPTDPNKTVLSAFPSLPIKLRKMDDRRVDFEAEGSGETNGLIIMEREMPVDDSIRARIWVIQSRENLRNVGEVLTQIGDTFGNEDSNRLSDALSQGLGASNPWIAVGTSILKFSGTVGDFFKKAKDRKMGFVNLDESFTSEEIDMGELDRKNNISAFGEIGYTWAIDRD